MQGWGAILGIFEGVCSIALSKKDSRHQIWCSQVMGGRPHSLCQFGKGGTASRMLHAISRTALASTLSDICATWPNSERWHQRWQTINWILCRPDLVRTSAFVMKSDHMMPRILLWQCRWKHSNLFQSAFVSVYVLQAYRRNVRMQLEYSLNFVVRIRCRSDRVLLRQSVTVWSGIQPGVSPQRPGMFQRVRPNALLMSNILSNPHHD